MLHIYFINLKKKYLKMSFQRMNQKGVYFQYDLCTLTLLVANRALQPIYLIGLSMKVHVNR